MSAQRHTTTALTCEMTQSTSVSCWRLPSHYDSVAVHGTPSHTGVVNTCLLSQHGGGCSPRAAVNTLVTSVTQPPTTTMPSNTCQANARKNCQAPQIPHRASLTSPLHLPTHEPMTRSIESTMPAEGGATYYQNTAQVHVATQQTDETMPHDMSPTRAEMHTLATPPALSSHLLPRVTASRVQYVLPSSPRVTHRHAMLHSETQ